VICCGFCDKQAIIHEHKKISVTGEGWGILEIVHQIFGKLLFYLAETQAAKGVNDPMLANIISHIGIFKRMLN
jgi:hypothetical protein